MPLIDRNRYKKAVTLCAIIYYDIDPDYVKKEIDAWWERLDKVDFNGEIFLHSDPLSTASRIFNKPHYAFDDEKSCKIYERLMYVVQVLGTRI
jgi:hypothetical protein